MGFEPTPLDWKSRMLTITPMKQSEDRWIRTNRTPKRANLQSAAFNQASLYPHIFNTRVQTFTGS